MIWYWYVPVPVWLGHYCRLRYESAILDGKETEIAACFRMIDRLEARIRELEKPA